jgi:Linalool dehydratase/isomerase
VAITEQANARAAGQPGGSAQLQLPVHEGPIGPVTARVQRRWLRGYLALWAAGLLTFVGSRSERRRTLAAGLLLPGGGYVYQGHKGRAAGSGVAAFFGFVMWVLLGMMFLPFTIWGLVAWLAARGSGRRGGGASGPRKRLPLGLLSAGPLLLGATGVARRIDFQRSKRTATRRNKKLATHSYIEPTPASAAPGREELSEAQLQFQRYLLDRALQPVEDFAGFEWLDQFREAAVRYQLNYSQWGLALAQYRCTPAFGGYATEAQRRLIEKMTDRRVWQYWRWENLWGNLRLDPDPIRKDNIMFSGYLGLMLAAYEASTGDRSFDAPDSLEFRWSNRKTFLYDCESLSRVVFDNMNGAGYCMFPCEPNWVYEVCNMIGFAALVGHDQLHETNYSEQLRRRFRDAVNFEFSKADGRPITIRASRAGIAIPGMAASTANEAAAAFFLSPSVHDIATRQWLLARDHVIGHNGSGPVMQSPIVDRMDLGQYKPTWGPVTYTLGFAAAREMGDSEAVASLEAGLARVAPLQVDDGVASYPGSVMTNMMMAPGVLGGERALHDLVAYGIPEEQRRWPRLAEAPYPDVLVARAVSDGRSLELVLRPGGAPGPVMLGLENLAPGGVYGVHGASAEDFTADDAGRATITIELSGRTPLSVVPAS